MNRQPLSPRGLPLNGLRIFSIAARTGSFTAAARELLVTQGAVSQQMQALERFLGVALFKRSPRGLTLTPSGQQLAQVTEECFGRLTQVAGRLRSRGNDIALMLPTCVMRWAMPRIMDLQARHPELRLQINTTIRHSVDFDQDPYDAAIVYAAQAPSGAAPLFPETLTPMCAPRLAGTALVRLTLLHATPDHRDWRLWLAADGRADVEARTGQNFETLDMSMNAAAEGYGIAMGDVTIAAADMAAGRLVAPFARQVATGAAYYFVSAPQRRDDRPVTLIREILRAESSPS
jgi:LysR family transcriptional regulator, glycine cleavage system transcriptional activator